MLVPFGAGAISAWGLLVAPLAFDFVRTASQRLGAADWERINHLLAEMEAEGLDILRGAGIAPADVTFRRAAEMRYVGQGHEVDVEVPPGTLTAASLPDLTARFEAAYRALYSRTPLGVPIEALNWRLAVSGPAPEVTMSAVATEASPTTDPIKSKRPAFFPEPAGYVETPVYDRYRLTAGMRFGGPAIIEERESTTVIGPFARISVDERLNVLAEPAA